MFSVSEFHTVLPLVPNFAGNSDKASFEARIALRAADNFWAYGNQPGGGLERSAWENLNVRALVLSNHVSDCWKLALRRSQIKA